MITIPIIIYVILIVFAILQLILFFKIWGATNDIRALKIKFLEEKVSVQPYINEEKRTNANLRKNRDKRSGQFSINNNIISYTECDGVVNFSDGKTGIVVKYPGYPECSIITDNNFELLYQDLNAAIYALYTYLISNKEATESLIEKRQYKKI